MLANSLSQQDLANAMASVVHRAPPPALLAPPRDDKAGRRQRAPEQPKAKKQRTAVDNTAPGDTVDLRTVEGYIFTVPKFSAKWFTPNVTAQNAQSIFRANGSTGQKAFRRAFERICRNCWFSGKGPVGHTVTQCRLAGNTCAMPCPHCGRTHWAQECSKHKK